LIIGLQRIVEGKAEAKMATEWAAQFGAETDFGEAFSNRYAIE
jgi:hypothetical protein